MFREGPGNSFCNYFLAFPSGFPKDVSTKEQKSQASASREGILELCWNHGTGTYLYRFCHSYINRGLFFG